MFNFGLYKQPCHRPAHTPEADENYAKAEVAVGISAVGGGADVACQGLSGPFKANSGHSDNLGWELSTVSQAANAGPGNTSPNLQHYAGTWSA